MRIMRVANKAARTCLDLGKMDSCTRVLERAADYEDALGDQVKRGQSKEVDSGTIKRLRMEYLSLRMALVGLCNPSRAVR